MPRAICTRCGALFVGWALRYRPDQPCSICGAPLSVIGAQDEDAGREIGGLSDVSLRFLVDMSPEEAGDE